MQTEIKQKQKQTNHFSEIWYIRPVIVAGAVIMHNKMFDTETKHLSVTDGQLKVFLVPCGWRNLIFNSPSCTITSVTMAIHQNVSQIQQTYEKQLMFFISEETLYLTCEFVSNFLARYWYIMAALPCYRHSLLLSKVIFQVSTNIDHFFPTYTEKCDRRNFSYT